MDLSVVASFVLRIRSRSKSIDALHWKKYAADEISIRSMKALCGTMIGRLRGRDVVLGQVGSGKVTEFAWLYRWRHAASRVFILLGFRPVVWFFSWPVCLGFLFLLLFWLVGFVLRLRLLINKNIDEKKTIDSTFKKFLQ